MAEAPERSRAAERDVDLWQARTLLRAARVATLGTQSGGQPFTALVTPAMAPDLSVLLLLSSLSEHTRQLRAEPRCALMVVGAAETENPQTAPRITLTGLAEPAPEPELLARWLAIHPYGALYAGFGDFAIWRMRPVSGLFVGGFARAMRLRHAELAPDPAGVAAIAAAEAEIIAHCNADHPDAMGELAGIAGRWRVVAVDVDGCDLAPLHGSGDAATRRIAWSAAVADAHGVRKELIGLLRRLRLSRA